MSDRDAPDDPYLWDPDASPHPAIARLERELAPLRHQPSGEPPWSEAGPPTSGPPSRIPWRAIVIAALVAGLGTVGLLLGPHAAAPVAAPGNGTRADRSTEAPDPLLRELDARRDALPPEARELIQRNLSVVDAAIRQLERAPADTDPELSRLLEQRRKMRAELLRSAVRLASES